MLSAVTTPLPWEGLGEGPLHSPSCLSVTPYYILAGGYLFQCHGATGVEFLSGDAYLGTESELGSVGE